MNDLLNPDVPAGAFDEFLAEALPGQPRPARLDPDDGPLPALYLSHGAPPLFEDAAGCGSCSTGRRRCPSRRRS